MGRKASRKWDARARRYWMGTLEERAACRRLFGQHRRFFRGVLAAVATLVLLAVARPAAGQIADVCTGPADATVCTGPVDGSMRFEWTAPDNVPTPALNEALVPRVRVDGGTAVELTGDLCTGTTPAIKCTAPIPAGLVAVMNVVGAHSVSLRLFDPATGIEGPSAIPFVLRSPPGAPGAWRVGRSTP